jgi:hypothetical protein
MNNNEMERKHIQKAYVMLMTMKMFKMSTSFPRIQTEDVKNKQDLHKKRQKKIQETCSTCMQEMAANGFLTQEI